MFKIKSLNKDKKAFGDAISTLIMFIAVISVTAGLVVVFQNYVVDTQDSFSTQSDLTSNKLRTSVSIINVYYNTSSNTTYIYVKNVGETSLDTSLMDLFIDESYFYADNFDVVDASDLTTNLTLVQPQETMAVVKQINLTAGSHDVQIVTEYGVGDEDSFNI